MSRLVGIIIMLSAMTISGVGRASSADFVWDKQGFQTGLGIMYLLGKIEPGDYERFVAAIRRRGANPFVLEVRSGGGDVNEAIRIGRLVRELAVSVHAPIAYMPNPEAPSCHLDDQAVGKHVDCICASACTLIWFGGVMRIGAQIYIHSIANEGFGSMSPAEAGRAYRQAMESVKSFLNEMGIDPKYADMMTRTGSTEIRKVRAQDDYNLFSWDPAFREWLFTKCGKNISAPANAWGECIVRAENEATVKAIRQILMN